MRGKRITWPESGRAELEEFDVPALQSGQVLIRNQYSVISPGTERAWMLARPNTTTRFPHYPGYSSAGVVLETAADVDRVQPGDRVLSARHASHAVLHTGRAIKIENDDTRLDEAAFATIAIMSLQGVRKARIELGESIMVMGQGLMGLFATQFAHLNGGLPVVALDFDERRRALASAVGADHVLAPDATGFEEIFKSLTHGRGADVVMEVTGSSDAMKQALACAAQRGRIIALGCARGPTDGIDFYRDVHRTGVSIMGAHDTIRPGQDSSPGYWNSSDDYRAFLGLLAAGRLKVAPLISEEVKPGQAPEIYGQLAEGSLGAVGIVFNWR